jgi:branched-chain amino acid transport system substrate-binding protein
MMVVERNGGKLGGVPVQVIREDSQLKPDVATQLVQKLIEKDNVSIITGITFSNADDGGAQAHRGEGRVPHRLQRRPGADRRRAVLRPSSSSCSWQNDQQAEVVGKYATDKGYKRVIGMAPNYQAGKDFVAGFKRHFKGEMIDEIHTPLNQPDFSAELAQVAAKEPDAVYVFYPWWPGVNFVRQYQQAGLLGKVPLLSASTTDGTHACRRRRRLPWA